eukprot:TRINITY_DN102212_c0_g1_i1.p1 TRINITY_DN102212_c0_g1~~TRINITY_DN102212_c0_g1_i1.p1  ORF type:complete len:452 (-),score=87.35 TRINITY_DN102212_c0_g1_i1:154-1509(-)
MLPVRQAGSTGYGRPRAATEPLRPTSSSFSTAARPMPVAPGVAVPAATLPARTQSFHQPQVARTQSFNQAVQPVRTTSFSSGQPQQSLPLQRGGSLQGQGYARGPPTGASPMVSAPAGANPFMLTSTPTAASSASSTMRVGTSANVSATAPSAASFSMGAVPQSTSFSMPAGGTVSAAASTLPARLPATSSTLPATSLQARQTDTTTTVTTVPLNNLRASEVRQEGEDGGSYLSLGLKVRIKGSCARYAGQMAIVEGPEDDQVKLKLVEGDKIILLSPLHIETEDGVSVMPATTSFDLAGQMQQNMARLAAAAKAKVEGGLLAKGRKVLIGGEMCPQKYSGKIGYVDQPDLGDGTARVRMEATFSQHDGYISSGGTFKKEFMTLEEAKAVCATMGGCGFTHKGGPTEGPVQIFFKNKWDVMGTGWTSYKLEPDPEGLPAWTAISHLHLTPL